MTLRKLDVKEALRETAWSFSNDVLYRLCSEHPQHVKQEVVLAKILMIGRIYAAAIERRQLKEEENDDFYVTTVGPQIIRSELDAWISRAKTTKPASSKGFATLIDVHAKTMKLFKRISGQNKRSLASKYLHFHVPELFFILDSRAVRGMSKLSTVVERASRCQGTGDNDYRKFAEKCLRLQKHCKDEFGIELSPRQLDNLLLQQSLLRK